MADALQRLEEEKKVKVDRQMTLVNTDRVHIIIDLSKDLKKITLPTFHGNNFGKDVEAWITSMEKYFMV